MIKSKKSIKNDKSICFDVYLLKLGIPQQKELETEENYKIFINKFVKMLKSHN